MQAPVFVPSDILLPAANADLGRWAVLACDQFTSQPEYWQGVKAYVGGAPSTLDIILPEVYLEQPGTEERIKKIHSSMKNYLKDVLCRKVWGYVYVEREISTGVRQGLVGCVDLEAYNYTQGAQARIRPSENTVVERIPPRLAVRRGAALESPHILMLCDDPGCTVIEPLEREKDKLELLYDQELMKDGGRVRAWAVTEPGRLKNIEAALAALEDEDAFNTRYGAVPGGRPFALAVGDGNHSLATAKAGWEELKKALPPDKLKNHPARYCLVELENIQSPAIGIEPIHRVVFGATGGQVLDAARTYAANNGAGLAENGTGEHRFLLLASGKTLPLAVNHPAAPLAVGTVEGILTVLSAEIPDVKIDYVHGDDAVEELVAQGAVGILLPALEKSDLFRGVALGGVLPKKTFSMGHAVEKRYYLECRQIV